MPRPASLISPETLIDAGYLWFQVADIDRPVQAICDHDGPLPTEAARAVWMAITIERAAE